MKNLFDNSLVVRSLLSQIGLLFACVLLSLLGALPVHAQWQTSYRSQITITYLNTNGTTSVDQWDSEKDSPEGPFPGGYVQGDLGNNTLAFGDGNYYSYWGEQPRPIKVKVELTVWPILTWIGSGPMPSKVYFKEAGLARVSTSLDYWEADVDEDEMMEIPGEVADVDNSLGDKEHNPPAINNTVWCQVGHSVDTGFDHNRVPIWHFDSKSTAGAGSDAQGRPYIVLPQRVLSAESGLDGIQGGMGSSYAEVQYNIEVFPYAVWISSPAIENSYKKVENVSDLPTKTDPVTGSRVIDNSKISPATPYDGPNSGPWGVLCEPDSDGKMTVHSVASHLPENDGADHSWFGGGKFQANTAGLSDPITYTWEVQPSSFINPMSNGFPRYSPNRWQIDFGPDVLIDNTGGYRLDGPLIGSSSWNTTLTVKAEDPGILLESQDYNVIWHKPVENPQTLPLPVGQRDHTDDFESAGRLATPAGADDNFPLVRVYYGPRRVQIVKKAINHFLGLGEIAKDFIEDNRVKALLIVLGRWDNDNLGLEEHTTDDNESNMFSQSKKLTDEGVKQLVPPGKLFDECELLEPMHWRRYTHEFQRHDCYNAHGYEGQEIVKFDVKTNQAWVGLYEALPDQPDPNYGL